MSITLVLPTDTPNAGRVKWNDNDTSLQADIDAAEAALDTHKSSSDHDSRYYTEAEIDAQQSAQDAALNTHKTSADHDGRYYTETESDARYSQLGHNHDDRYFTETESDARYVLKTEAKRRRDTFVVSRKSSAGGPNWEFSGIEISATIGLLMPSPGCIVGALLSRGDGSTQVVSLPYASSGSDRRFGAASKIHVESLTPGIVVIYVNGTQVTEISLTSATNINTILTIVVEYDPLAGVGYEENGT